MRVKCLSIRKMTKTLMRSTYLIMEFTIPINREKSEPFSTAQRGLEEFSLATCYTRVHI